MCPEWPCTNLWRSLVVFFLLVFMMESLSRVIKQFIEKSLTAFSIHLDNFTVANAFNAN